MNRKELMQTLHNHADVFTRMVWNRNYQQARREYDAAVRLAVDNKLTEEESAEIFGIRGEGGVILRVGAFNENQVIEMMDGCLFPNRKPKKNHLTIKEYG